MTEESDAEDVVYQHKLIWRSEGNDVDTQPLALWSLQSLCLSQLWIDFLKSWTNGCQSGDGDGQFKFKKRVLGTASIPEPPPNCVPWAVATEEQDSSAASVTPNSYSLDSSVCSTPWCTCKCVTFTYHQYKRSRYCRIRASQELPIPPSPCTRWWNGNYRGLHGNVRDELCLTADLRGHRLTVNPDTQCFIREALQGVRVGTTQTERCLQRY